MALRVALPLVELLRGTMPDDLRIRPRNGSSQNRLAVGLHGMSDLGSTLSQYSSGRIVLSWFYCIAFYFPESEAIRVTTVVVAGKQVTLCQTIQYLGTCTCCSSIRACATPSSTQHLRNICPQPSCNTVNLETALKTYTP